MVGNLTHENIIRCHGLLIQPNAVIILQELALDGDLFNQLDVGFGLPAEKAVRYMADIAAALRYIHDPCVGLVHMDIKVWYTLVTCYPCL